MFKGSKSLPKKSPILEKLFKFSFSTNANNCENQYQKSTFNVQHEGVCKWHTPAKPPGRQTPSTEQRPFMLLGAKMVELYEFIKTKRSVHQTIKNAVEAIRFLYNRSQKKEKFRPKKTHQQFRRTWQSKQNVRNKKIIDIPSSLTERGKREQTCDCA